MKKEAKKDKKNETLFSLTLFDTEIEKPYVAEKLSKIKELDSETYNPDGMTALYDAVCVTIEETKKKVKKMRGKVSVVTVILTDGEENSSVEYTQKGLAKKIKELKKEGWTFVFLGANQDSWSTATQWGIDSTNIANFNMATDQDVTRAFRSVGRGTVAYMASASLDTSGVPATDFFNGQQNVSEEFDNGSK